MEKMTGYRMKIVEKEGTKLVDILHKSNPVHHQEGRRQDQQPRLQKKELCV